MRLRLMEYNVQDLFLKLAYKVSPKDIKDLTEDQWQQLGAGDNHLLKPLFRLYGMAQAFDDVSPDIVMLCEVAGQESLETFNELFLDNKFDVYYAGGTSERGYECAFLVRRSLGLKVEISSHSNIAVDFLYPHEKSPESHPETVARAHLLNLPNREKRRMSRDIPELRIFSESSDKPALVILMAHLKSGYDPDGIDPGGLTRRAGELKALLKLRSDVSIRLGDEIPVILGGDLNGRAARQKTAEAFTPIYRETDLKDALEVAGLPQEDRLTHLTFISSDCKADQLDYIFIPKSLHDSVVTSETFVYRYCYEGEWDEIPLPTSLRERSRLPSDHYPVICTLEFDSK